MGKMEASAILRIAFAEPPAHTEIQAYQLEIASTVVSVFAKDPSLA